MAADKDVHVRLNSVCMKHQMTVKLWKETSTNIRQMLHQSGLLASGYESGFSLFG